MDINVEPFVEAYVAYAEFDANNYLGHSSDPQLGFIAGLLGDRVTVQGHYTRNVTDFTSYECGPCDARGGTTIHMLTADALFAVHNGERVRVDIGAGVGGYYQDVTLETDVGNDGFDVPNQADGFIDASTSGFAYRWLARGAYRVTDRTSLTVTGVYSSTGDRNTPLEIRNGNVVNQPDIARYYSFGIGIRRTF